jgi:hypothetical protein
MLFYLMSAGKACPQSSDQLPVRLWVSATLLPTRGVGCDHAHTSGCFEMSVCELLKPSLLELLLAVRASLLAMLSMVCTATSLGGGRNARG